MIEEEADTGKIVRLFESGGETQQGLSALDREPGARGFAAGSPFAPAAYNVGG